MAWNPLNMGDRQASNLALVVGLGICVFCALAGVLFGFRPDTALLSLVGTGCIAQRWLIGGRRKDHDDDRQE